MLCYLGLAFVLMLRPFFPELVMSTDLVSFEHPSVLLFCFNDKINMFRAFLNDGLKINPGLVVELDMDIKVDKYNRSGIYV